MTDDECHQVIESHEEFENNFCKSMMQVESVFEIRPNVWSGISIVNEQEVTISFGSNLSFLIHGLMRVFREFGLNNLSFSFSREENGIGISDSYPEDYRIIFEVFISEKNNKILIKVSKNDAEWLVVKVFSLDEMENAILILKSTLEYIRTLQSNSV